MASRPTPAVKATRKAGAPPATRRRTVRAAGATGEWSLRTKQGRPVIEFDKRAQPAGMTLNKLVTVLGGTRVLGARIRTREDLDGRIRAGLPYRCFETVTGLLGVKPETLATTLVLPERSLARRKQSRKLSGEESDRLCRVARVYAHAVSVFGDQAKATTWMSRPNRALGDRAPMGQCDTDLGVVEVDELLGRIEYGILG